MEVRWRAPGLAGHHLSPARGGAASFVGEQVRPRASIYGMPPTPENVEALVEARGVGVTLGNRRILVGIDLAIFPGEFVAVMGPSGSGKSTLLYCLAGLERCSEGSVTLAGVEISTLKRRRLAVLRRDATSFIFQSYNLLPFLTVRENVAAPVLMAGRRADRGDVEDALRAVGLHELGDASPALLSGGEQQRVAIARALIGTARLVIADEPTGALDSQSAHTVLDLIEKTRSDGGRGVVLVTHDPATAARADRVVFLRDGRLVEQMVRPSAAQISARVIELSQTPVPRGR